MVTGGLGGVGGGLGWQGHYEPIAGINSGMRRVPGINKIITGPTHLCTLISHRCFFY